MNKELLKQVIVSNDEYIHKYIKFIVKREGILLPKSLSKVFIFYGARRSGKTFILFDLFKKYAANSIYLDFEDDRLQDFSLADFGKLKEVLFELKPELIGKKLLFFLDEVQNVKAWEKFCRRAVERENINIFVSGSSSKIMPYEIHTELRGRAWSTEVLPFSFREYLCSKKIDIDDNNIFYGTNKPFLKNHFLEYLNWGGFPETSLVESEFEKRKLLKEYMSAMFFRDLVERYKITNIQLLETLINKLFSSFSTKLSLTSFYKQYKGKFPLSKDLLFKYYKHILESMLVFEVNKFAESTYKRTRNPSKIYLIDTGLCKRLTSKDTGRQLENVIYLELRRRGYEIFYFEEGKECDFIASKSNKFFPFQITYELNENNTKRETEGIIEACKWFHLKNGTIITYDEEKDIRIDGININIVPAWKWLVKRREIHQE